MEATIFISLHLLLFTHPFVLHLTTLISNSNHKVSNNCMTMNNNLEMLWKEAVMAYFKTIYRHVPAAIKGNYENPHKGQQMSWPIFHFIYYTIEVLQT